MVFIFPSSYHKSPQISNYFWKYIENPYTYDQLPVTMQNMTQSQTIKETLSSEKIKNRFLTSGISHLSLFWSYARDEATKNSDLDLLIELSKDNRVTLGTLEDLQEILVKECKVKKVDFVTKRKINPYLKEYIEKDLITIF